YRPPATMGGPGRDARDACLQATENRRPRPPLARCFDLSGHQLGGVGTRKVTTSLKLAAQRYDSRSFAVRCPGAGALAGGPFARPRRPQETADEQEDCTG